MVLLNMIDGASHEKYPILEFDDAQAAKQEVET
jgi:hypothetical protein